MVTIARRQAALRECPALIAVGIVLVVAAAPAAAQNYKTLPSKTEDAALRGKAATILRASTAPTADDLKALTSFFTYYYTSMTGAQSDQLAKLEKNRVDLFRQFLNLNGSPAARDHVLALTIKAMTAFAKGNFHPAVRYNAALVLGQLDKAPAGTGAGAAPPTPLPASTAALVEILEGAQANAAAIPPAVMVGALVGLERQTRLGVDPQFADRISKGALAVAMLDKQPEDVSKPVFDWMRALAARVLANQQAKGLTPPANAALIKLMADKKMGLDDRCAVAETLKASMFQAAGAKPDEAADALGALAKDVLAEEAEKGEDYQGELLPDSGGGGFVGELGQSRGFMPSGYGEMGGGGQFGGMTALDDNSPRYEKRRMLDRVGAITAAAGELAAAGSAELKTRMKDLANPMNEVAKKSADSKATDADVAEWVIELSVDVNRVVSGWKAEAPAEAAGDEMPIEAAEAAPGN